MNIANETFKTLFISQLALVKQSLAPFSNTQLDALASDLPEAIVPMLREYLSGAALKRIGLFTARLALALEGIEYESV